MTENTPNPEAAVPTPAADGGTPTEVTKPAVEGAPANPTPAGGEPVANGEDYKTKFSESSKEANRLLEVLKQNGIDPKTGTKADAPATLPDSEPASGLPNFTDAELEATFPSYATMSAEEQAVIKQIQSFPQMARMVAEMYDKTTFNEQLEVIKAVPDNKIIADNEKEFKAYAYEGENLKLPIDVLVNAFIGKKLREGTAPTTPEGGNPVPAGMEDGTGAAGAGDAVTEMTPDAARELRTKDPRQYAKLAKAGKLKIVAG